MIAQVAQRAEDLDRATGFYTAILGVEPSARFDPPGLVFFSLGQTRLLLDRAVPSALVYLAVEDVRVTVDRLRAEGVDVETEPHVIFSHEDDTLGPAGTDEWMAFIKDSEGNTVGLVSHAPTPEPADIGLPRGPVVPFVISGLCYYRDGNDSGDAGLERSFDPA